MEQRKRLRIEVPPHICSIEQTIEFLPSKLVEFKESKPFSITYYDKSINTFRTNENIQAPSTLVNATVNDILLKDPRFRILHLSKEDAVSLVNQEWRTNMTRMLYQARINPHQILDGPVVTRSKNGVIQIQECLEKNQVPDALSTRVLSPKKKVKVKKHIH
ncbi:hypothetical protein THRCLA_21271 [Thraustotheca clavata]|uniref:Uncharacterized protein n=1 Tax=Thraustotheca clavata TaxID=74557 RepID=A0A1V9ZYC2_9STRA|nr:hypothetical protein THRCLA_21271 [Thraustotheca clavata]